MLSSSPNNLRKVAVLWPFLYFKKVLPKVIWTGTEHRLGSGGVMGFAEKDNAGELPKAGNYSQDMDNYFIDVAVLVCGRIFSCRVVVFRARSDALRTLLNESSTADTLTPAAEWWYFGSDPMPRGVGRDLCQDFAE